MSKNRFVNDFHDIITFPLRNLVFIQTTSGALEFTVAFHPDYRCCWFTLISFLVDLFSDCGLRPAHRPRAGFFTLWEAPDEAFGEKITSGADFNFKMIDEVGLVGVHFSNFIRYAVCADVEKMATGLETALRQASLKYN